METWLECEKAKIWSQDRSLFTCFQQTPRNASLPAATAHAACRPGEAGKGGSNGGQGVFRWLHGR